MKKFREFFNQLEQIKELQITVGVFGEEAAEVAFYNEYGTKHIPARSFIRSTLAEHQRDIVRFYIENFQKHNDAKMAAAATSQYIEGLIVARIASGHFTPNAPATIKKKGRNQPLIDTGRMMNSVKGVVR